MKKRSLPLRLLLGCSLLALLGMLYWSSVLQEKKILTLQREMSQLREQMQVRPLSKEKSEAPAFGSRSQIDSSFPNLLHEDPFYTATLPRLLGTQFIAKGTRKQMLLGHPDHLHPFNSFHDIATLNRLCTPSLATLQFGKYETLSPNLALKIEERPTPDGLSSEYLVHLRDNLFWQPLNPAHFPSSLELAPHFLKSHPVTAHDFKFYYDAVMNPSVCEMKATVLRAFFSDIEEFRILDPLTFAVRWKVGGKDQRIKYSALGWTAALQPLPCFVYKYFPDGEKIVEEDEAESTYRTHSVWAQNFSHHFAKNSIVSCGPWIFGGMNEEGIKLVRNPDFHDPLRALSQELHYTFKESLDAMWQEFKAAKCDLCILAPSQLAELTSFLSSDVYRQQESKGQGIHELDFVEPAFSYIGWNLTTPFFQSKKVRQALTLAIDRERIIAQNLNGMALPITGPFFLFSPANDSSIQPWPFDPYLAARLLEEEGWIDLNGDGIRDKMIGGKRVPFRFTLNYYSKNVISKMVCDSIATALREVGIDCHLSGLDITDLSQAMDDKSFDALFMAWTLGSPPEDPRQLWHSKGAKEKGSSNAIGFANPQIDALIEELTYEYDKEKRLSLYHAFHRIIHEEAPYTFLYSPKRRLLYRDYVKNLFIPKERQDLVPGANIPEPDLDAIYLAL